MPIFEGLLNLLRPAPAQPEPDGRSAGLVLSEMPVVTYAVGDVHGCLSLYRLLEDRLIQDGHDLDGQKLIVLLGDVIDRGPDSAGMIEHLTSSPPEGFERICLLGNHEDSMLRFLEDPSRHRGWLQFGGRETLASYGVRPDPILGWDIRPRKMQFLMQAHIPGEHIEFLQSLPLYLSVGDYFLVHAGIDPKKPLHRQARNDLLWIRPGATAATSPVGKKVVHGHTPVEIAGEIGWRIQIDTGAVFTGRLSAAKLTPDAPASFLTVSH